MTKRGHNPKTFLTEAESARVVDAIQSAERITTGEIRVRDRRIG